MKKQLIFLSLFLLCITAVTGQTAETELKEGFNNNTGSVPSPIMSLINGEIININLDTEIDEFSVPENASKVGVSMVDDRIKTIQEGGFENKTLQINITAKNIDHIKNATSPIDKTADMVQNGDIEYKAYTLGMEVKTTVVNYGLQVMSLF